MHDGVARSRGVQGAAVLLADGQAVAAEGELPEDATQLARTLDAAGRWPRAWRAAARARWSRWTTTA
ncbi:hypothetical protein WJ972_28880 [Achromobacter insuavis]